MEYLRLGASLYVPAIHRDISKIANGIKFNNLKSVIFDTEDSITTEDLPFAYININNMLDSLDVNQIKPLIFIRVRNPEELIKVSNFKNIEKINGFVLPKFSEENMNQYLSDTNKNMLYMPILEKNIFHLKNLENIRDFLLPYKEQILSLRIGATDLLSCLNLRRGSNTTIYEISVLNQIISNIVITFKPYDFNITGAVWESFAECSKEKLQEEVSLDLLNGLFGKSIIHPWQIDIVQDMYKVSNEDYEIANQLLDSYSPAVFKSHNKMNEKATHSNWAKSIIERAKIYGLKEE